MRMFLVLTLLAAQGCASTSKEDAAVQLHRSGSVAIANCEQLGPVSARTLGWTDPAEELKKRAREQYGADAVVLLNRSMGVTGETVQGTALRCFKK
jgi:hypothetical protein